MRSFLSSDNPTISDLNAQTANQTLGLLYLLNAGDLDQDGGDEVLLIIDRADWSQVNSCLIFSWHQQAWKELHRFIILESTLRDFPRQLNQDGSWDQPHKRYVDLAAQFALTPLVRSKGRKLIEVRAFDLVQGKAVWKSQILEK